MVCLILVPDLCTLISKMFSFHFPCFHFIHLCSLLYAVFCRIFFNLSCVYQDALTDLTGDSERLPVEEQHGTWLGHKVRDYCLKTLTYNTLSRLLCAVSSDIFPLNISLFSIAHFQQVALSQTSKVVSVVNSRIIATDILIRD